MHSDAAYRIALSQRTRGTFAALKNATKDTGLKNARRQLPPPEKKRARAKKMHEKAVYA